MANQIRDSNWTVNVPLNDLLKMQNSLSELDTLRAENSQLRTRLEGLHRTLYELMSVVADLRKGVPDGRGA